MDGGHSVGDHLRRRLRVGQIFTQHEGDFRFDLGLDRAGGIERAAIGHSHVVEQHPEVRLVDAKLRLNRLRRQSSLAPDDAAALSLPEPGVDRLHSVGTVGIGWA